MCYGCAYGYRDTFLPFSGSCKLGDGKKEEVQQRQRGKKKEKATDDLTFANCAVCVLRGKGDMQD